MSKATGSRTPLDAVVRRRDGEEAISPSQQLLEQGKYLIVPLDGYWHMILPPSSWLIEILGESIFRTGFCSSTPETEVREFYVERLNVHADEILKAV